MRGIYTHSGHPALGGVTVGIKNKKAPNRAFLFLSKVYARAQYRFNIIAGLC